MAHERHTVTFQAYDTVLPDTEYNATAKQYHGYRLQRSIVRFVIQPPLPTVYDPTFIDTATKGVISKQRNLFGTPVRNVVLTHSDAAGTYGHISVPSEIGTDKDLQRSVQHITQLAFQQALSPLDPQLVELQFSTSTRQTPEAPQA